MPAKSARSSAHWKHAVRSAVLHVIGLAQYAIVRARLRAARSHPRRAENDRLRQEVALLREEVRIKDARMAQLAPARRPHYPPHERLAILELRAARSWSLPRTARTFLVTPLTIRKWLSRLDEQGEQALVQLPQPVNKYPRFVSPRGALRSSCAPWTRCLLLHDQIVKAQPPRTLAAGRGDRFCASKSIILVRKPVNIMARKVCWTSTQRTRRS